MWFSQFPFLKASMPSFKARCCKRDIQFYRQGQTEPVNLPVPESVSPLQKAPYKIFLIGMVELINSYLRPDVKSKWIKMELIMVPVEFFKALLLDLGPNKPFSAWEARHPSPLKNDTSTTLYYNVYNMAILADLFQSTSVPLKHRAYFRHNEEVRAPALTADLTALEKIVLARQHAGSRWGPTSAPEKPTSRRVLKCEEGEWPRTREFQLIWWPNVFLQANFGHLRLRFFVEHIELVN